MSLLNLKDTKVEKSKVFKYRLNFSTAFLGVDMGGSVNGDGRSPGIGSLFQIGTVLLLKKCFLMLSLEFLTKSL